MRSHLQKSPKILIITTCSALKAASSQHAIPSLVNARNNLADGLSLAHVGPLVAAWTKYIDSSQCERYPVDKLYRGAHWQASLAALASASKAWDARLWVLSAGYGLVPVHRGVSLVPYEATFSRAKAVPGQPEQPSVSPPSLSSADRTAFERHWWRLLMAWHPRGHDQYPRSLSGLFGLEQPDAALVIASSPYVSATLEDLRTARANMTEPSRFALVSAGLSAPLRRDLGPSALQFSNGLSEQIDGLRRNPADSAVARDKSNQGSAAVSLNARVARYLLASVRPEDFEASTLQVQLDRLDVVRPQMPRAARQSQSPEDVMTYLQAQPDLMETSATALLRRFRQEAHRAFEEKHFRYLVKQARETGLKVTTNP